ncbi:amidase family protein [Pseudonocardia sp. CA-107938]|uniref:amidase family protein n=1 Tax=Pseudonocardia sp. CA-107938 TaxID=3240021 RepID=UPI003D8A3DA5
MHDAADLTALDAVELVTRVHDGLSCAVDVAEAHLTRIAARPGPSPFVAHDRERVMLEAAAVDTRHDRFALPLAGVPIAVADTIDVSGWATRHGPEPARRDDELVRRLRAAGAVVVGSTRAEADAVGERLATLAVGTDHGDGLRVGAAERGLVAAVAGLPDPGRTGVLARSARDAALLLGVLGDAPLADPGHPARVALSLAVPAPFGRSRRLHADQRAAVIGAAARLRAWPGEAAIVLADPPYPMRRRAAWRERAIAWLDAGRFDLLLCPAVTGPLPADAGPLRRTVLTRAWSAAGLPAVVAPVLVDGRLAAVQLVGRPGAEGALLAAAAVLERRAVPATGAAAPRVYA